MRGVVTASSGNHAQAVALSAALHDLPATILMPEDAPASKAAATEGYGATIVRYDRYADDREALLRERAEQDGLTIVHPYDDERIMAGQGTAALELIEDGGELDALLVPVGGGGLIAGCATAATALCPGVRVIGVEPAASDDTARSFAAGERVSVPPPRTIADGQQLDIPGERTFPVVRERVAAVVTVTDAEIVDAMRFAFERLKLVLEPSGASALAALLHGRADVAGRPRRGRPLGRQRRRRSLPRVDRVLGCSRACAPRSSPSRPPSAAAWRRTARAPCSPGWPRARAARSSGWRSSRTTSR